MKNDKWKCTKNQQETNLLEYSVQQNILINIFFHSHGKQVRKTKIFENFQNPNL